MASTYSTDLKLELMVTGENAGTWGTKTNSNLNLLQQAIAGYQAISIAGGPQTTALVMSNAEISTARNAVVKLTGTITGNQVVTIPDGIEKTYIVENGTSGAFTVQFKTVSGTGPTFSTTDKGIKIVYSDGTNVVDVNANLSGPTLASDLDVNGKSIISTSNGNIVLAPNGTGDVQLDADTVRIGDSNANATLTTNGTGDLILNTNSGSNSGSITIKDGTNGDIEITPNGSGVVKLDGLSYPTTDGSADQVLKTNGSGILSFTTISSSPTQLVSAIPLATSVSVTAGKVVSINSSGEIPAYPTLNTYGTTRANSTTTAYFTLSLDGSRAIRYSFTSSGSYVLTFAGVAISNSATPTNGTVNQTASFSFGFSTNSLGGTIYAISNTTFMCNFYTSNVGVNECGQYYDMQVQMKTFILTVDSSGNVTKGSENTNGGWGYTAAPFNQYNFAKISNDVLILKALRNDNTGTKSIITWSGTTVTLTSDTDSADFAAANGQNAQITTNNIIGLGSGNSWKTATWTASPVGIGASSDTAPLTGFLSGGTWYMMKNSATANAEYALATFTDTNGVSKYSTFSINQTTGALTSVQNGNFSALVGFSGNISFKDKDNLVAGGTATSYNFTNGVLNGYNSQSYTPVGTVVYNSGDLFYIFYTSLTGFPNNIGYTVNAFATAVANYLGVVKTTTSASPASIVTDGVATGFTSLTAGTLYYAVAPFNGEVTTSSASGIFVGKAISTTEILLQRSNTQ